MTGGDVERLERELAEVRERMDAALRKRRTKRADQAFAVAHDQELALERELAAARGEAYAVPFELGVRWSGGAPLPHLLSSGRRSFVAFYLEEWDPDWDGTYVRIVDPSEESEQSLARAEFTGAVAVKLGPPNDEALDGHPLYERGLSGYGAYVVEKSRWLQELIAINRGHERFDPQSWQDKRHFLLVFNDETVEAIARGIEVEPVRTSMRALLNETIERLWT
jgi:hypothetical protein